MTKTLTRLVAALAITVTCGGFGVSAASAFGTDAEQATATLRAVYQGPNPYGVFKSRDRSVLGRVLTPALVETWAGPEADGPQSDGSPITWYQMTDSVRLTAVTPRDFSGDHGTLDATVDAVVEGQRKTTRITWDMRKVGGRWLADDSHVGGKSFRAVFAGFAPAAAPSKDVRGPLPLRVGDYKAPGSQTCYGMTYWSNHLASGMTVGDARTSLYGYNCEGTFSRKGQDWLMHGTCSTGNGRFAPPPMKGTIRISVLNDSSFRYAGTTYNWCNKPDYME